MSYIILIGYRGTGGFDDPEYENEPALIKAGHVGIQCEGDERIFGFHPTPEAIEAAGGIESLIDLLQRNVAQPGAVFDDTAVFVRAYELAQQGERTSVWQWSVEVDDEDVERICQDVQRMVETQQLFPYNFPFEDGSFNPGESNCAIFPQSLGIPLPSTDGQLRVYIPAMIEKGAVLWTPPSK